MTKRGRPRKTIKEKKAIKGKYDNHYYQTVTKIKRMVKGLIKKAEKTFYADADKVQYRDYYVNHFSRFSFDFFFVGKMIIKDDTNIETLRKTTEKYFKNLHNRKLIIRALWTYEKGKENYWHTHAIIKLKHSRFADRITELWHPTNQPYLEKLENKVGSLIYITKEFSTFSTQKESIDKLAYYHLIGDYDDPNQSEYEPKKQIVFPQYEQILKTHGLALQ